MRSLFSLVMLLALVSSDALSQEVAASKRAPNIVLLYADDAGYADFGFQPSVRPDMKALTPNIDRIASGGVRLSNAYMSGCVCSPSRAGMMTGRYQTRFGHEQNIPPGYMKGGLPLEETMMPARLKALGYATAIVGKWHLGYPDPYQPNRRGFDWFYGLLQGARGYFPLENPSSHQVIQENGTPTKEEGYVTDRFGDAAVRFIKDNREKPFFLFVSFTAPHGPMHAKPEDLAALSSIERPRRRRYAGMVKSLDDNVGKVLAALKAHDLERDTLVIFTNDNGGQTGTGADNAPLRGKKGTLFEGGVRVPMCMRWPGKIAPGSVIDDPVISLDYLPTFVAMAGGQVSKEWRLDGLNLLPRLTGASQSLPRRALFWRKGGAGRLIAMREGSLKLLFVDRAESETPMLFDLASDIGESKDLAGERQEDVKRMGAALSAWEREQTKPRWGGRRRGRKR